MHYVKGTLNFGVRILKHSSMDLYAFSDVDWAGCPTTRRSTTVFCSFLGFNCISWSAKKQPTVARSSAEAEYRAMVVAAAEFTWLSYLFHDIGMYLSKPPTLFYDNLLHYTCRLTHFFMHAPNILSLIIILCEKKVALGSLITRFVSSKGQLADIFTKPLPKNVFRDFRGGLLKRNIA